MNLNCLVVSASVLLAIFSFEVFGQESEEVEDGGGGYWNIKLSPNSITSVPFGSGHISVWEHASTPGRYYVMPLVYLLKDSAKTRTNVLTGKYEMTFDVLMWSVEAREAVYRHLKDDTRPDLAIEDIEMLPMEKVRISWKGDIFDQQQFRLQNHWKSNTHLPSAITFQFTCSDDQACSLLAQGMKEMPEQFHGLELEYVINGQKSARRDISVTGKSIYDGRLFTQLKNMPEAADSEVRFLSSSDLKTIVAESTSDVVARVITDSDYVNAVDEVSVSDLLEKVLSRDKTTTEDFTPHMWDSVFWNPTFARPDKVVTYLNKALEKNSSDTKNFYLTEEATKSSGKGSVSGSFKFIKAKASGEGSSSKDKKVKKEDVLNALKEKHNHVEWTGEVFRVKPMKLHRLNLSKLNTSASIGVASLQIHRYESVQTISVRLSSMDDSLSPSLTPQLVQQRLQDQVNSLREDFLGFTSTLEPRLDGLATAIDQINKGLVVKEEEEERRKRNPPTYAKIACDSDNFHLACPVGKTIDIVSSNYGRTKKTVCTSRFGPVQWNSEKCYGSNTAPVKARCQGQQLCSFTVSVGWYGRDPCHGIYKYLQVSYRCL